MHSMPNKMIIEFYFTTSRPSSSFVIDFVFSLCWLVRTAYKNGHFRPSPLHQACPISHCLIYLFHKTNRNQTWGPSVTCCSVRIVAVLMFRTSCIYVT